MNKPNLNLPNLDKAVSQRASISSILPKVINLKTGFAAAVLATMNGSACSSVTYIDDPYAAGAAGINSFAGNAGNAGLDAGGSAGAGFGGVGAVGGAYGGMAGSGGAEIGGTGGVETGGTGGVETGGTGGINNGGTGGVVTGGTGGINNGGTGGVVTGGTGGINNGGTGGVETGGTGGTGSAPFNCENVEIVAVPSGTNVMRTAFTIADASAPGLEPSLSIVYPTTGNWFFEVKQFNSVRPLKKAFVFQVVNELDHKDHTANFYIPGHQQECRIYGYGYLSSYVIPMSLTNFQDAYNQIDFAKYMPKTTATQLINLDTINESNDPGSMVVNLQGPNSAIYILWQGPVL